MCTSPFFSRKQTTIETKNVLEVTTDDRDLELVSDMEPEATMRTAPTEEESFDVVEVEQFTFNNMEDEPQVAESPPRTNLLETAELVNEDEIIFNSPPCSARTGIFLGNPSTSQASATESPQTQPDPLPSPPASFPEPPLKFALATDCTPTHQHGTKKPYTPRPSHTAFPDTPMATPTQSMIIQNWKQRFLHPNSTSTLTPLRANKGPSKLHGTISARPITPVRTPLFGKKTMISSQVVEERDQIEDSPPRRNFELEHFKYTSRN